MVSPRLAPKMPASPEALLDTSYLVRYLTDDPPELSRRAAEVIDSNCRLAVSPLVLAEAAYVLTHVYQVPRQAVVDQLIAFLQKENITCLRLDKGVVIEALLLCRPSGRVSFADALIWAEARLGPRAVYTFDERFPALGVEVLR